MRTALIDPKALATELGVAESTLANWRCAGRGPRFVKLGAAVRYRRADVDLWLDGGSASSTSDSTTRTGRTGEGAR